RQMSAPDSSPAALSEDPRNEEREKIHSARKKQRALDGAAHRLPNPYPLSAEFRTDAVRLGLPEHRVQAVFDEFCDYWHALPGKRAVKLDWRKTWRNRIRTVIERAANGHGPRRAHPVIAK